jgi:hypothetical protein
MLRITVHRDGGQCRLELSGRLCGPWVGETETVWRSAACSGEEIEVDIREVTGLDDAGYMLLAAMHEAGARFAAQGVAMTALIEEITGKLLFNGDKRQRPRRNAQGRRFPDQERK